MHNLTCAACGRALAATSAWKGSGERFYCNDFCAEAEETDINLTHEESRTIMRRIANDYDRLAKFAEEQLADQERRAIGD